MWKIDESTLSSATELAFSQLEAAGVPRTFHSRIRIVGIMLQAFYAKLYTTRSSTISDETL
jgi:hypothetical protein